MAQNGTSTGKSADYEGVFFKVPGVVVVGWDAKTKAVCVEWQSWASPTEFAAALNAGLGCLKEHRARRWLADCLDMKAVKQSDQDWLDRNWFPRAFALGLKRVAVVVPTRGLSRMAVDEMMARVPPGKLDVAYFETVAAAREWLEGPLIKTPRSLEAQPAR